MRNRRFERGDVPVGCIVGLLVLLVVILISFRAVPLMINVGELDREISILADRANRLEYNDERILKDILYRAEALLLPVTEENVKIERTHAHINIWVEYTLEVDLFVYTYVWNKKHHETRPLF
jgi:hypothetical protein